MLRSSGDRPTPAEITRRIGPIRIFESKSGIEQTRRQDSAAFQNQFCFRSHEHRAELEHPGRRREAERRPSAWQQFDLGWVELWPRPSPAHVGAVVAVLIKHLGFWSLNGCRVAYESGANGPNVFGYAYVTLPNHAESGEELFEVSIDPRTDDVSYRIRATSKPQALLTTIGQPIVRVLQARFRRDSAEAMRRAIAEREARS